VFQINIKHDAPAIYVCTSYMMLFLEKIIYASYFGGGFVEIQLMRDVAVILVAYGGIYI
jgi:hypothetical protein